MTERYNVTHRCLWVNMRIVGNLVILCHTLFFREASDTRLFLHSMPKANHTSLWAVSVWVVLVVVEGRTLHL